MQNRYRIGEYFSGPGGMFLGARLAAERMGGVSVGPTFAVDFDADACSTYHANIHGDGDEGRLIDSRRADEKGPSRGIGRTQGNSPLVLVADAGKVRPDFLSDIDGFIFGFPCNDFSMAGERLGVNGKYGLLYRHGIAVIEEKIPAFFVAENVTGILHANEWGAFAQIMSELRSVGARCGGYDVVPHLYKFEEYGVPQTRHRVVIVGIRRDILPQGTAFAPPAPRAKRITAGEALAGIYEAGNSLPNNMPLAVNEATQRRLDLIPTGKCVWDVNDTLPPDLRLHVKETKMSSIYRILDPAQPAYTVIGAGGGGTYMYHWDKRRTTDRERACLQTFPTSYVFSGRSSSVRKQIGMAVPPEGAAAIFEALFKTMRGMKYDCVKPNLTHAEDHGSLERRRARKKAAELPRAARGR